MAMVRLIYVAGPSRGADAWEVERNIRKAEELGYRVAQLGAYPQIPHTNTRFFTGTLSDEFRLLGTIEWLRRCDGAIFTPDWERSGGARVEHEDCVRRGMPIFYSIEELKAWLKPAPQLTPATVGKQLPLFGASRG